MHHIKIVLWPQQTGVVDPYLQINWNPLTWDTTSKKHHQCQAYKGAHNFLDTWYRTLTSMNMRKKNCFWFVSHIKITLYILMLSAKLTMLINFPTIWNQQCFLIRWLNQTRKFEFKFFDQKHLVKNLTYKIEFCSKTLPY